MTQEKNNLSVPMAIIIAGTIIALAVFFALKQPVSQSNLDGNMPTVENPGISEINFRSIDKDDYVLGNPNAEIMIVTYTDLECPACKFFHSSVSTLLEEKGRGGEVALVYRQFPLTSLHRKAETEAQAILCAGKIAGNSGFWDLVDKIFEITPSNDGLDLDQLPEYAESVGINKKDFSDCLLAKSFTDRIQNEYNEAVSYGARGTPFSIIVLDDPLSKKEIEQYQEFVLLNRYVSQSGEALSKVINNGRFVTLEAAFYPEDMVKIVNKLKRE